MMQTTKSSKPIIRTLKRKTLTLLSCLFLQKIKTRPAALMKDLRSIAVFSQEKLGDALLLTPLVKTLKRCIPDIQITMVTFSKTSYRFWIDDLYVKQVFYVRPYRPMDCINLLRQRYDIVFNPKDHPSYTALMLITLMRTGCKIGIGHELHQGFYHALLEIPFETHVIYKNLALIQYLGFALDPDNIKPYVNTNEVAGLLRTKLSEIPENLIAINLSAGEKDRCWNSDHWIQLIDKTDELIIIFATGNEIALKSALERRFKHVIPTPRTKNLAEVLFLLRKVKLLISPDTSLVHLALITDTPVIGLYRNDPVHHQRFSPLSSHSRKIISKTYSVNDIDPQIVHNAMNETINELDHQSSSSH